MIVIEHSHGKVVKINRSYIEIGSNGKVYRTDTAHIEVRDDDGKVYGGSLPGSTKLQVGQEVGLTISGEHLTISPRPHHMPCL